MEVENAFERQAMECRRLWLFAGLLLLGAFAPTASAEVPGEVQEVTNPVVYTADGFLRCGGLGVVPRGSNVDNELDVAQEIHELHCFVVTAYDETWEYAFPFAAQCLPWHADEYPCAETVNDLLHPL